MVFVEASQAVMVETRRDGAHQLKALRKNSIVQAINSHVESPAYAGSNHGIAVPLPPKGCPPLNVSPKIHRGAQGTRSTENAQGPQC